MGRYVTPRGVVVETSAEAAGLVGYKPVEEPKEPKKAPTKKSASSKSKK